MDLKKNTLMFSLVTVCFQGRSGEYKSRYVYHFFEDINLELFYINYSSFLTEKLLFILLFHLIHEAERLRWSSGSVLAFGT
jgi:hypothetical protein